jgi:hypothetical protein
VSLSSLLLGPDNSNQSRVSGTGLVRVPRLNVAAGAADVRLTQFPYSLGRKRKNQHADSDCMQGRPWYGPCAGHSNFFPHREEAASRQTTTTIVVHRGGAVVALEQSGIVVGQTDFAGRVKLLGEPVLGRARVNVAHNRTAAAAEFQKLIQLDSLSLLTITNPGTL